NLGLTFPWGLKDFPGRCYPFERTGPTDFPSRASCRPSFLRGSGIAAGERAAARRKWRTSALPAFRCPGGETEIMARSERGVRVHLLAGVLPLWSAALRPPVTAFLQRRREIGPPGDRRSGSHLHHDQRLGVLAVRPLCEGLAARPQGQRAADALPP